MNDKEKLLLAIRRSVPRKLPQIFLEGWSHAGFPQAPDDEKDLPANSLIIEMVALEPSEAHRAAVARAEPRPAPDNPFEAIKERLRNETPR